MGLKAKQNVLIIGMQFDVCFSSFLAKDLGRDRTAKAQSLANAMLYYC